MDYDVIIIGAGPAGASCAKHLTDKGVKTLIIEKEKLPRDKSCSGIIFNNTEKFIKKYYKYFPNNILSKNKYKKFKYSFDGNKYNVFPLKKNFNIERKEFDFFLIEKSNADIFDETTYINHVKNRNIIEVKTKYKKRINILKCNYLIGADGSYSSVRKKIDLDFDKKKYAIGLQWIVKSDDKIPSDIFFHLFSKKYSDFFAWFGIKNNFFKFGTSFYYSNRKKNYIKKLSLYLKNKFHIDYFREVKEEKVIINLQNDYYFGSLQNIFLIGEAACLTGAFGEGIHYALLSGKLLAESIVRSGKKRALNIYLKKIKKVKNMINTSNFFLNINKKMHNLRIV